MITFSYSPIPGENKFSADIVINIDLVYKEGLIRNNIDYELAFILLMVLTILMVTTIIPI